MRLNYGRLYLQLCECGHLAPHVAQTKRIYDVHVLQDTMNDPGWRNELRFALAPHSLMNTCTNERIVSKWSWLIGLILTTVLIMYILYYLMYD